MTSCDNQPINYGILGHVYLQIFPGDRGHLHIKPKLCRSYTDVTMFISETAMYHHLLNYRDICRFVKHERVAFWVFLFESRYLFQLPHSNKVASPLLLFLKWTTHVAPGQEKMTCPSRVRSLCTGCQKKKVYSSILGIIQKQYNVIKLFFHTLLTKCLFTFVHNFKCVSCVTSELWTRENSPVKLGFVHKLPMLCT